jgi:acyl carrier protein
METSEIEALVLATIRVANQSRAMDKRVEESPTAVIFGPGSALDSIGLVTLLIDIEDALRDRGVDVLLIDERAISQKRSPFRDVPSLTAHIQEYAKGQA